MPKSADETAEQGENLHDDSDVIELTEEIPGGDSSSKEDASSDKKSAESPDESPEDLPGEDEFDALTRDMPEFRVPERGESAEDDEEIVELRDRVDPDAQSTAASSETVPSAAILSGRRSSRKDASASESVDPESDADQEEDLTATIIIDAQQRPEDEVPAPEEPEPDERTEVSDDEATSGDDDGYDRQEMVKTIQMTAIDRKAFERQVQAEQIGESVLLLDHCHAPDVVVFPPRVLTTRWKEGGPLLRAGQVEPSAGEGSVDTEIEVDDEVSGDQEVATAELESDEEPEPIREFQDDADEAGEVDKAGEVDEPGDEPTDIEEAAQTLEEEDFPEIEPEAVEIELDSEAIEDANEVKPPPKPAPQSPSTKQASSTRQASSAKPPKKRDGAGVQKQGAQKQQDKAPAKPAKDAQDNDPELSGLVQELLDENKPSRDERKKKPQKARSPRETWFQNVFTEEYLRTLPKDIHRQTKREVDFIEESFDLDDNDRVLDLACGFGRHAIELTRRGHEVAGLDLSMPLLQKALNEAQKQSLSIKFIHGDMRELSFEGIFNACYLWQTSFGFFDDQTNFRVLRGIHRALKPGGRLLIDVLNRDHIVTEMPHRLWWEGVECVFLEEVDLDHRSSVLHTKRSFIYEDGSPPLEQNTFIRIYSLHELSQLLHAAGFAVREVSGELHHRGRFLGSASSRIIVHAQKRPPRGGRK